MIRPTVSSWILLQMQEAEEPASQPGLVAIDYLGLITAPSKANANGGRQQEVAVFPVRSNRWPVP
jgi:hypothetical protein